MPSSFESLASNQTSLCQPADMRTFVELLTGMFDIFPTLCSCGIKGPINPIDPVVKVWVEHSAFELASITSPPCLNSELYDGNTGNFVCSNMSAHL